MQKSSSYHSVDTILDTEFNHFNLPPLFSSYAKIVQIQKATDSSLVTTVVLGGQWHDIELPNCLFCDLQVTLSKRKKALAEAEKVTIQAKKESEKAMEREHKMEQRIKRLEKERDDALEVHARGREDFMLLSKAKEDEAERIKEETKTQVKAWQEKEKDC